MRRAGPLWHAPWILGSLLAGCTVERPVPPPEMPSRGQPVLLPDDPHHEFDFWLGEWDVQNKLVGSRTGAVTRRTSLGCIRGSPFVPV